MNIFIRGVDSSGEYQTKILNKIWKEIPCEKCVIVSRNIDGKDKYPKSKYVEIKYTDALKEHLLNPKEIDSIPEDILCNMKQYETRIYETMIRDCLIPIYFYEECKKKYIQELYYWYHIIKQNNIKLFIFFNIPHYFHDYMIYCLAKSMDCKTLIFYPIFFAGRMQYGTECEHMGIGVGEKYGLLKKNHVEMSLSDDLMEVYNKYRWSFANGIMKSSNRRQKGKQYTNDIVYVDKKHIKERREKFFKDFLYKNKYSVKEFVNQYIEDIEKTKRCRKYIKNNVVIEKYNRYKKLNSRMLKQKYIYFGLQSSPEAAIMPYSAAFYDQKCSIIILAKSAEKAGIKVYIKEHWIQEIREKELYECIEGLDNVYLFGPNEDTTELMKNSIAVSTCSGSCIMEGMFNNKPAITFGDGYWVGAPGVFRVHNEKDCTDALNKIIRNEVEYSDEDIITYLKAVECETIPLKLYPNQEGRFPFTIQESVDDVSDFIINWIKLNVE